MKKKHKVLILCGGGVFGVIPSHFLSLLPYNNQNLKQVDTLAGCSIGGILAAAYATGASFGLVDSMFIAQAEGCFKRRLVSILNPLANPTYDSESLYRVVDSLIGIPTLGDVRDKYPQLNLIIPALNITDDAYKVFNNIDDTDKCVKLADIAKYTSAAPSYFAGCDYKGKCIVDGGMIEVAPLLTTVTALKGKLGIPFEDMDVLMMGTGRDIDEKPLSLEAYNELGLLGLATKVIVPYVTLSNEMATRYWGEHLGFNSFNYFNPCVNNGELDNVNVIPDMVKQVEKYSEEFIEAWYKWIS